MSNLIVPPFEGAFEYNHSWGGPAPAIWLPAGHQANAGTVTAFDLSPYGRRGTWTNGVTSVGTRGRVWTFGGLARASFGNPASLDVGAGDWTILAWINTSDTSTEYLFVRGSSGAGGKRLRLRKLTEHINVEIDDDSTGKNVSSTADIVDGTWHLVGAQRQGSTLRTIVDGVEDGTTSIGAYGSIDDTTQPWRLGEDIGGSDRWHGDVASLAMWRAALTDAAIWEYYTSTLDGSPGCLAMPIGRRVFAAAVAAPSGAKTPWHLFGRAA